MYSKKPNLYSQSYSINKCSLSFLPHAYQYQKMFKQFKITSVKHAMIVFASLIHPEVVCTSSSAIIWQLQFTQLTNTQTFLRL